MAYVHGYSQRETQRLYEQAEILEDILHIGTAFPARARVLEAGCGVGGQTRLLLERSPDAVFTCIDISENRAMLLTTVLAADAVLDVVPAAPHRNRQWVLSSAA
jgi:trans-aconitate methyltransferase